MTNYYLQRTLRAILTVWLVVTLTFGMIRLLPGGPLTQLKGELLRQGYPPDKVKSLIETRQNIRPDQPITVQYIDYITSLMRGDLGNSFNYSEPVIAIVSRALPWTIFVMVISVIIIFAIAIVLGALMAYRDGSNFDTLSSTVSILLSSIPFYVLAVALVVFFGYILNMFPTSHHMSSTVEPNLSLSFILDVLHHATLPIASMVLTGAGLQALAMRGNSIQVLGSDYVRVARLRGLSDQRISVQYVARNAILPMWTGFLTLIGFYIGGSVILEEVFTYNGIGYYMYQALEARDYSLMMGIFLVITVALVLSLYIADLTYGMIDPRVKSGDTSEAY